MTTNRYIILELSDAKKMAGRLDGGNRKDLEKVITRIESEEGGDFEQIVHLLKKLPLCHACEVEGQQSECNSLFANKLGRRLGRLLNRAK